MSTRSRCILTGLGLAVAIATVASVVRNWDAAVAALDAQSVRTEATLFRLGELMSIAGEVEEEYGVRPDLSYETDARGRVLTMVFRDHELPAGTSPARHARELAAFTVSKTKKSDQVDVIEVRFLRNPRTTTVEPTSDPPRYSFTLEELMTALEAERTTGPAAAGS